MSFVTVFAGGIALTNVGPLIWIWMVLSAAIAVPFVYFMCPEVRPVPFCFCWCASSVLAKPAIKSEDKNGVSYGND